LTEANYSFQQGI